MCITKLWKCLLSGYGREQRGYFSVTSVLYFSSLCSSRNAHAGTEQKEEMEQNVGRENLHILARGAGDSFQHQYL